MLIVDASNQIVDIFVAALRQIVRGRIWLLLVLWYLCYELILYAHYDFTSPLFYTVITWWTSLPIFPDTDMRSSAFTHYPGHLILLGGYFGWAKLTVGAIFEGLVLGAVARMFAQSYGDITIRSQLRLRRRWVNLALGWIILNSLLVGVVTFLPGWLESILTSPRRILAFNLTVLPFCMVLLLSMLYFVLPLVAIRGENVLSALKQSLEIFGRRPFTCFFLAAIVTAVPYSFALLAGYAEVIVQRFNPDLVFWILTGGVIAELLAAFLWMGTAVRFLGASSR